MSFYELNAEKTGYFYFAKRQALETPMHFHSAVEVFFLKHGEQEVQLDGETRLLRAGDACFFDSFSLHAYPRSDNAEGYVILAGKEHADPIFTSFNDTFPPRFFHFDNFAILDDLYTIYSKKHENEAGRYAIYSGIFQLLIGTLSENVQFVSRETDKQSALVCSVLRYANEHLKDDLSLKTVASVFGYSHEHLSRILHRYLREHWNTYINRQRVRLAREKLHHEKALSVLEILYDCGFDSPNTFYRAYKKEFGIRPRR